MRASLDGLAAEGFESIVVLSSVEAVEAFAGGASPSAGWAFRREIARATKCPEGTAPVVAVRDRHAGTGTLDAIS